MLKDSWRVNGRDRLLWKFHYSSGGALNENMERLSHIPNVPCLAHKRAQAAGVPYITYSLKLFDKDGGAICRAEQGRWRRLHVRWFPLTCKQALFGGVMCDCFV